MSGTYPVDAYLYRIKKEKSPNCTFCDHGDSWGQRNNISLSICQSVPYFHHARTTALNLVRQAVYALADWKFVEETPMYLTGLRLQEVPTAEVHQA